MALPQPSARGVRSNRAWPSSAGIQAASPAAEGSAAAQTGIEEIMMGTTETLARWIADTTF